MTNNLRDVLNFIESKTRPRALKRGELVFSQGDPAQELYFLKNGVVRVYTITEEGNERNILLAWPGRFFAASSFFNKLPRQTSAVALKDIELLPVNRVLYEECAVKFSGFQQLLLEELSMELFAMFEQLADVSLFDSSINVARFICRRSAAQKNAQGELPIIEYTQDMIASILGLSRWSVNKAMAEFKKRGWLEIQHGKIILLDFESIHRFAYGGAC